MNAPVARRRHLRAGLLAGDEDRVRALVTSSGFFSDEEIAIAVELVAERRARGDDSGYHFVFLDVGGRTAGYTCYGPIPATLASWDLYWIAVDADLRGRGHGRRLLRATERLIARHGGDRVWVDTSSRPRYAPTRAFYERCGYHRAAELPDFYRPGDSKVIYCKALGTDAAAATRRDRRP